MTDSNISIINEPGSKPRLGDLVILSGNSALGVALQQDHSDFIKVLTVRGDGKRETAYYLPRAINGPDPQRLASLVRFYDVCVGFYDGSAACDDGSDMGKLLSGVRGEVFGVILATATAIEKFDAPTSYSRARVLLDFAKRSGAGVRQLSVHESTLIAAKEATRARFDVAGYYKKVREAGYEPSITGFDGRIAVGHSLVGIKGEYPREADEIDIDHELREYVMAQWERRPPGSIVVPLGV